MTLKQLFRKASKEIRKRGWGQHMFEGAGGRVCLLGAVGVALAGDPDPYPFLERPLFDRAQACLRKLLRRNPLVWNDAPGRTVDQVLKLLAKAEREAPARVSK